MNTDYETFLKSKVKLAEKTVLDPFSGLGTVPYRAIFKGRKGIGFELSPSYFLDGVAYCKMAENEMMTPSLFSVEAMKQTEAA